MTDFVQKEDMMKISDKIKDAARSVVKESGVLLSATEIPTYQGMYVAKSGQAAVQPLSFFIEEDEKYVIGPLRKE